MGEQVKIEKKGSGYKLYNAISAFDTLGYADLLVERDEELF